MSVVISVLLLGASISAMRFALRLENSMERLGGALSSLGALVLAAVVFGLRPNATPMPTGFVMVAVGFIFLGAVLGIPAVSRSLYKGSEHSRETTP